MSSNKRIEEAEIDRLSALPDFLLTHILSFLEMKKAGSTALLSKRWRFLWTELPCLLFRESSWETKKIRRFVARVHGTLVNCSRNNLERFEVEFRYQNCFACDVNVWIEFSVKNKVKHVRLGLLNDFFYDFHMLPQIMYSNASLTTLWMEYCIMAPRRIIEWHSLVELHLEKVRLSQSTFGEILSGCHVLRYLHLIECRGYNCLVVNSPSLCKLEVHEGYYIEEEDKEEEEPLLEISAPYILSLDIKQDALSMRKLRVTNIPSHVICKIDFDCADWNMDSEVLISTTKEHLENFKHVNELELGYGCILILSSLVIDGWKFPQSRRGCLKLHAYTDGCSNYGIFGLLESSPNLETLVIEFHEHKEVTELHEHLEFTGYDFPSPRVDFLYLKMVKIKNLAHSDPGYEPLLMFPQILLRRAVVLEKMVIELKDAKTPTTLASGDYFKIAQTLLSYPRSSQKAVVLLRQ